MATTLAQVKPRQQKILTSEEFQEKVVEQPVAAPATTP